MNRKRKCRFCNLKFVPKCGAQKFCDDDCRERYNEEQRRKARIEKLGANKVMSIAEVNQMARDKGMTYGKFVAEFL